MEASIILFVKKHLGITYRCDECEYQVGSKRSFRTHVEIKHLGIKYTCNECKHEVNT